MKNTTSIINFYFLDDKVPYNVVLTYSIIGIIVFSILAIACGVWTYYLFEKQRKGLIKAKNNIWKFFVNNLPGIIMMMTVMWVLVDIYFIYGLIKY